MLNTSAENSSSVPILDAGADDCVACPFDTNELQARIRAVMRRFDRTLWRTANLAADRATLCIRVRDVTTRVFRRQLEMFLCLAERRERWVHSDELIAKVCGTHHDPATSLVRVQMHALRKALGPERGCIRCAGHRSYMLTLGTR